MLLLIAILSAGTVMIQQQSVFGQTTVQNTLTILGTCGLGAISDSSFGSANPGAFSDVLPIDIVNTGNKKMSVEVFVTDWYDQNTGLNLVINGERTAYSDTQGDPYNLRIPLNSTIVPIDMGDVIGDHTNNTYWQVEVILVDTTFIGTIQQSTVFDAQCP